MLYLKTIKWKNFISTGAAWTEIDLTKASTTLIVGENGAGKSTLLDAISYLLYGKPFRNINLPTLVNSINQKHMQVEGTFETGGKSYRIIRGMKPNVFEVYQGDSLLNQEAANRDYQDTLTKKILKMKHKTFCQIVMLGSASFVPFMQLPAAARREVVEDLLDIQLFSKMNALHKAKVAENESELNELEHEIRLAEQKIKLSLAHVQELKQNNDALIKEKQDRIAALKDERDAAMQEAFNMSEIVERMTEELEGFDAAKSKRKKFDKFQVEIDGKLRRLRDQISFFHDTKACPTCQQAIDAGFSAEMVGQFQAQVTETEDATKLLHEKMAEFDEKIAAFKVIQENINKKNLEISHKNIDITHINSTIASLEREIKKLSNTEKFDTKQEDVGALEEHKARLQTKKSELLEEQEMYKLATLILKDTGIKARIIKQYIPVINKLINKYLASMDFFVNFELDETFKETIKSRYRDEFSYASFSEGEKARINLALLFTWRAVAKLRNSASTNLLIMDEVFDGSLDAAGSEELMKVIQTLTADTNTFIITHKSDSFMERFENTLKFEKHNNFSRLVA